MDFFFQRSFQYDLAKCESDVRLIVNNFWIVCLFYPLINSLLPLHLHSHLQMNETYQHPGKWRDVLLIPTLTRSTGNHYVMSHVIRGLEGNSVYEAIVQAKNRYGWNEVKWFCHNCKLESRNIVYTIGLASSLMPHVCEFLYSVLLLCVCWSWCGKNKNNKNSNKQIESEWDTQLENGCLSQISYKIALNETYMHIVSERERER